MVMILGEVPAPEATLTPTEGTMIDAQILAQILGLDAATAQRLFAVASELVSNYASAAPDPIRDEAIIRTASYLKDGAPHATLQRLESGASVELEFLKPSGRSALRFSGSMSLLSPYKKRRGMVVG